MIPVSIFFYTNSQKLCTLNRLFVFDFNWSFQAYEQVAESFAKEKGVVIANVDADQYKDLGSRFGVQGFPTLKFFSPSSSEPERYLPNLDTNFDPYL